MPILEQDFYNTYYSSLEKSIDIFYSSTNPFPINSELDI